MSQLHWDNANVLQLFPTCFECLTSFETIETRKVQNFGSSSGRLFCKSHFSLNNFMFCSYVSHVSYFKQLIPSIVQLFLMIESFKSLWKILLSTKPAFCHFLICKSSLLKSSLYLRKPVWSITTSFECLDSNETLRKELFHLLVKVFRGKHDIQ